MWNIGRTLDLTPELFMSEKASGPTSGFGYHNTVSGSGFRVYISISNRLKTYCSISGTSRGVRKYIFVLDPG